MILTLDLLTCGGHHDGVVPAAVDGVEYVLSDLTGWWGSPAPQTSRTRRRGAPGSFRRAAYKDVRAIEIVVTATATDLSRATMRTAERLLAGLCADPAQLYLLTVEDDAGILGAYVELDGEVLMVPRDRLPYSSIVSIPVCALDPRRVAPDWTSSVSPAPLAGIGGVISSGSGVDSSAPGVLAGIAPSLPEAATVGVGSASEVPLVFQIDGDGSDMAIVDSRGPLVSYRGNLNAGETVWINCDSQDAYDVPDAPGPIPAHGAVLTGGGDARSAVSVQGGWPRLAAGESATFTLAGTLGAAQLTVWTREAWT